MHTVTLRDAITQVMVCQTRILPGEEGLAVMPYSEVNMHMRIAGKIMRFRLLPTQYSPVVQILNDDGTDFSFPISYGEGGVYQDTQGYYYYKPL